ncbi:hypothetical protein C5S31_08505 [ANME-1 cluster archaeon GoMg2]|nr:hypothetical protein [ANME-1 cluster archaeon GoMg2]
MLRDFAEKENPCFFGKAFFLRNVCAKRKTKITFLVTVFTESKKVVGNAFLSNKNFLVEICEILWLTKQSLIF